jgi:hypothetical protein
VPPATAAVCDWHSWLVAARAPDDPAAIIPAASSPVATRPAALVIHDTGRVSLHDICSTPDIRGRYGDSGPDAMKLPGAMPFGQVRPLEWLART